MKNRLLCALGLASVKGFVLTMLAITFLGKVKEQRWTQCWVQREGKK